ncbi:hypothetical protein FACS1894110_26660 [Spirochaetia bacterium]|nr:hypothetical protein FACS1894110_26660 [Spirochaetia bacterium]
MAPVIQIVFMLSMLGTMKIADLILVMTNGQPGGMTEVVMTYIFKFFFQYGVQSNRTQFGYGSALAIITAAILAVITLIYLRGDDSMRKYFSIGYVFINCFMILMLVISLFPIVYVPYGELSSFMCSV